MKKKTNLFGSGKEKIQEKIWDWDKFKNTKNYPVSNNLLDWVIGQERALKECYLSLDEWLHKLKWMEEEKWYKDWDKPGKVKPSAKSFLSPGPYLLLLGAPGTGKSLIGRALASHLTELYKKSQIRLKDVVCWPNKVIPSEPRISLHSAGEGKKLVNRKKLQEEKKVRLRNLGIKGLTYFLMIIGLIFMFAGIFYLLQAYQMWLENPLLKGGIPLQTAYGHNLFQYLLSSFVEIASMTFLPAGIMMIFLILIVFLRGMGGIGKKGIGGAERTEAPKLIVDNSKKVAPFIDATGHSSAQLFGSIAWDPLQCYDSDTRLVTLNGLKRWSEIKKNDLVFTLNPKNRELEILPIKYIYSRFYEGEMIRIKGQRIDLFVTPEHRIFSSKKPNWNLETEEAEKLYGTWRRYLPTRPFKWISNKIPVSEIYLKLLGWYITEGHPRKDRNYIIITQKKHPQIIEELLMQSNLSYYKQPHGKEGWRFVITDDQFYHLALKCGKGSRNKKIPREILELPHENLEVLFKTLMLGNGSHGRIFHTTSYQLALNFIELCLKTYRKPTLGETRKGFYWISTSKSNTSLKREHWFKTPYKGIVWCIHLEKNHNFLVERNGKFIFCGNTGGLGTPEHQRTSAGDVHRAFMGILYIDEIKNLKGDEAVTLLTVLEDGQLPITLRSRWHASGTAAMAVATEPVPCMCFLVGAGNFDSIYQIHPALMDRLYGYGKVVRMNNDMPNTLKNRRKLVQFIAQEIKRFHLLPFSKEACIELIEEARRRSGKRNSLTTRFRPLISIIKTASTLAENKNLEEVKGSQVIEAIKDHCKTIQKQLLEHQIREKGKLLEIEPKGHKLDTTYGLAVVRDPFSGEETGSVLRVKASMVKKGKRSSGYFKVAGIAKEAKFIKDSIEKVRSVILRKYGIDIAQDYCTHIDFSQAYGVDGPSAGVTMTILICALLEGKPIRQNIAVTGEINLSSIDQIEVTAVGGLYEKIKAAERWGFKKVIIPKKNYIYSIDPKDYKIKILPAKRLEDYLQKILIREMDEEGWKKRKSIN